MPAIELKAPDAATGANSGIGREYGAAISAGFSSIANILRISKRASTGHGCIVMDVLYCFQQYLKHLQMDNLITASA